MVMMPQVTLRQSMVVALLLRSSAANVAPGITIVVDQVPSALSTPPLAAEAVSPPGKVTNFSKPWLSLVSLSGT